jgi:Fe-S-cluster containining protein
VNVACGRCGGACCESLILPLAAVPLFDGEWLAARGRPLRTGAVELPSRCPHLDERGLCDTYTTRPYVCGAYPVGGPGCRSAIERRRIPEEAAKILALLDEVSP